MTSKHNFREAGILCTKNLQSRSGYIGLAAFVQQPSCVPVFLCISGTAAVSNICERTKNQSNYRR